MAGTTPATNDKNRYLARALPSASGPLIATALAARLDNAPHAVADDIKAVPWEEVIGRT
ncbi:MAG: hypothetical protein WA633_00330 [Stellaceae bacterium]